MTTNITAEILEKYRECIYTWTKDLSTLSPLTPYREIVHNMMNKCIGHAVRQVIRRHYRGVKRVAFQCITKCMFIYLENLDSEWLDTCIQRCIE